MSALHTQIGGDHYRNGTIQPVQYIEANKLQFLEGSVVKRVTRHDRTTGKGRQDIEKAIHELQLLLELRYSEVPTNSTANGLRGVRVSRMDTSGHYHYGSIECDEATSNGNVVVKWDVGSTTLVNLNSLERLL
jgi:hypothetical protein